MAFYSSTPTTSDYVPVVLSTFPPAPLTTVFLPPAECTGFYWGDPYYNNINSGWVVVGQGATCLPPSFATDSTSFFSPGLECPRGYYTACHDTQGVASITTVRCCPYVGGVSLSCADLATPSDHFPNLFCTWSPLGAGTNIFITESNDGTTSTVAHEESGNPAGVNAFGVRMVYQSTDLVTAVSSSSSLSSSSTLPPSTSNSSTEESLHHANGLSTGEQAAIGVVVPVIVLGAALAGFLLWRRRKRANESRQAAEVAAQQPKPPGLQEPVHEVAHTPAPQEMASPPYAPPVVELSSEACR
ncbi:hypothetical protein GGR56DRAFT_688160 [Xylariaceae sp. FL0804]|nr:hypothetical protein GGR56DRAFT_688160 [Xylariaceae sp. FL0804]